MYIANTDNSNGTAYLRPNGSYRPINCYTKMFQIYTLAVYIAPITPNRRRYGYFNELHICTSEANIVNGIFVILKHIEFILST